MNRPWSIWKVAGFVSLLSFFISIIVYQEQYPLGNFSDLVVQGLTVAGACGWLAAFLVTVRNRLATERRGPDRRSPAL
jgi:hypothetical protein